MIEIRQLTKKYGKTTAVDGLSFSALPGCVTGFVGPNGAGKSSVMRVLLGLDKPTAGAALVNGKRYVNLTRPTREIGALLDANAVHPGRSAADHLRSLAQMNGISRSRIGFVLEQVGLSSVARRRVGTYSLGMRQRLGIAVALLGDPGIVLLDEPANGLDPEGMHWIRTLLRSVAVEGRTVLVSSHLMNEMAQIADRLVVIGQGRLLADTSVRMLTESGRSLEEAYLRLTRDAGLHRSEATS
jgi:ABC-2 type transport system ATP-binding protein